MNNFKWAAMLSHVSIGNVFKVKMVATATRDSHYCTFLGHVGQRNTDRVISIGQGKCSSDYCMLLLLMLLHTNFTIVHKP